MSRPFMIGVRRALTSLVLTGMASTLVFGLMIEESNSCNTTTDDPCQRTGTCSIQGADWFQTVTVYRSDFLNLFGWPGVCDLVHVALVQGTCEPPGGQTMVTAYIGALSSAEIPSIDGPLVCAGEPATIAGAVPNGGDVPGVPLTVGRGTGDSIVLNWGSSCFSTDNDYVVYEGSLGSFHSHASVICSTENTTTWVLNPGVDSHYYLVVPSNEVSEGSQGTDSGGVARSTGSTLCFPQSVGQCQ